MIAEIAREFNKYNRINILNLLKQIKDLKYQVIGVFNDTLYYKSETECLNIYISFNSNRIRKIGFSPIEKEHICWDNIVLIDHGFDSEEIIAISEELYNKYFICKK